MATSGKYKYLAKNTLLFSISSFGSKLLSFLFVSLYTAVLSTEEYGTADLIITTSSLLLFVVTLNISSAVVRFALEKTDEQEGIFSFGLRVVLRGQLVFGLLLTIFAIINPLNWDWYFFPILFFSVFANSMYELVSCYLRAIDEIKSVAIAGILNTAVTILSNLILLLVFNAGVVGYLASIIIGYTISTFFSFLIVFRDKKINWSLVCDDETKREMIKYSVPLIVNGISWWVNNSLDRYLITYYCGVSVNGIYAVASRIPVILITLQSIFSEAWSLSAIKEYDKNDSDGFFGNVYSFFNGFTVLGASFLIIFNVLIAKALFLNDFFEAWEYSSILVASAVFNGLAGFTGGVFSVAKKTGYYALSTVIAAIINTVLNIVFIPQWGAYGAAVATLISFITVWLIRFVVASKYISWKINLLRDSIAYCLLFGQLLFEHFEGHCYIAQIVVVLILCLMYQDVIRKVIKLVSSKLSGIGSVNNG